MFDIGFFELLLVGIVGLVVIGPERLPDAVRTTVRWWTQIKQTLGSAKEELEREVGADDIRRELHNERVLRELKESQEAMQRTFTEAEKKFEQDLKAVTEQADALKQQATDVDAKSEDKPEPAVSAPDVEADNLRRAADYLPDEDTAPAADDYLPEEDEEDQDQEDPDYPEHLHDHGDPEFNPHHPDHFKEWEEDEWAEVDKADPADNPDNPDTEKAAAKPLDEQSTQAEDKRQ
ncbi:Sec-independent protein translocase protein TatB [Microbulbifer bruguierae]|uniref:Sec-independent protein translocase protein TatB n=1 Tax=Microbulbifer bruguierae TaxID=3029061 RepID=A0ABY8N9E8_9GAMM|nr:Sec-independent protein translocase protein TatB [Microbulbifer bruguierae]WGL15525.1 Sec-independent protein translocase protein TatB [Microbulbifer bruguierae]